jgi:hypothetical protein
VLDCREKDGSRWRRFQCLSCAMRWTISYPLDHKLPPRRSQPRRLTEAQVVEVLTSDTPIRQHARAFGVSPRLIQNVRTRERYGDVRPDLPAWQDRPPPGPPPPPPRCFECREWLGVGSGCRLLLPGPATTCSSYALAADDDPDDDT